MKNLVSLHIKIIKLSIRGKCFESYVQPNESDMRRKYRINIQVAVEALLLLAVILGILAYFSHQALRRLAVRDAEQTLEGTIQNIDNVLLGVEQATGNIYYDLLEHLNDPERMYTYSRQLVESNPNIDGCAICFKPGYYPDKDLFMAYVHRESSAADGNSQLVTSATFTDRPYTEQVWYAEPMKTGNIGWIDPLKGSDTEDEPLVTFCLPFSDKSGERIGVIAVDMSVRHLSQIILSAMPSENGYCVMLAHNGSYIVHPDEKKLRHPNLLSQKEWDVDLTEIEAAEVMLAGGSGMRNFYREDGDWYVFYRPFKHVEWDGRANVNIKWSVGVVCSKRDIFGRHNILLWQVLIVAVVGLLIFFVLCHWIIRRQMKPMRQLSASAQRIADGNYNEILPFTERHDEIGLLQERFKNMQQSLQKQVDDLQEETQRLGQEGDMLCTANDKTIETDRTKTLFLQHIAEQMTVHTESLDKSATKLCNGYQDLDEKEIDRQVDNIQRRSLSIVEMLKLVAHVAETGTRKEASHE